MSVDRISPLAVERGGNSKGAEHDSRPVHVVERGETLESIARHYRLDERHLLAANPAIVNVHALYPGDRISIPAEAGVREVSWQGGGRPIAVQEAVLERSAAHIAWSNRAESVEATRQGIQQLFVRSQASNAVPAVPTNAQVGLDGTIAESAKATFEDLKHKIPGLDKFVPQGMTAWNNWDGKGNDVLLVNAYPKPGSGGKHTMVFVIDPETGKHLATLKLEKDWHAASIAIDKDSNSAFIRASKTDNGNVNRYDLGELAAAIEKSKANGAKAVEVERTGDKERIKGTEFTIGDDGMLYTTFHSKAGDNDKELRTIRRYEIGPDGSLTRDKQWEAIVPREAKRLQGLLVRDGKIFFSVANGTNHGTLMGYKLPEDGGNIHKKIANIQVGALSQGMTFLNGQVYLNYESGASKFDGAHFKDGSRTSHIQHTKFANLTGRG